MRAKVTTHVLLGRKSLGRPAGIFAAVGTIWKASNFGGLNITEWLQPRNESAENRVRGEERDADPLYPWGRPKTLRKNQARALALSGTAGVGAQVSEERFSA